MDVDFTLRDLSPERILVALSGRITAANAGTVKETVREQIGKGKIQILFDLSGVTFLDSSGLAAFVSALKATREAGGWIKLAALSELPASIFKLTMLDRVIDLYPDVAAALEAARN